MKSSSAGEMIKGGGGTLNREIRVGVTHVSYFGQDAHFVSSESLYKTPPCNMDLDITWSCCGTQISLNMEFYKRIVGK